MIFFILKRSQCTYLEIVRHGHRGPCVGQVSEFQNLMYVMHLKYCELTYRTA